MVVMQTILLKCRHYFTALAGLLALSILAVQSINAQNCEPFLFLNCPGESQDPQSFIDGLTVQVNGATNAICGPSPAFSSWDWGDGSTALPSYFPGSHTYSEPGNYTLTVAVGEFLEQCHLSVPGQIVQVVIDIKPYSDPNSLNPGSRGVIPVAILTTDTFDALQVDVDSVTFGPMLASERHGRSHIQDVDGDGDPDIVFHFGTRQTGIECGDLDAELTGETFEGQSVTGKDNIKTVGCKNKIR